MILKSLTDNIVYKDNQGKTIHVFPSIAEFEIPDEALTNNYIGYIYEFMLLEDTIVFGKLYRKGTWYKGAADGAFGYHKKFGVYWHTSKNKDFIAIWYSDKKILRFRILKIHNEQSSWTAVKNEESLMLQKAEATQSKISFNGNNGFPEYEIFDNDSVRELVDLIKEQQFIYDTINKVMVDMEGEKHFPESKVTVKDLNDKDKHDRCQPRKFINQQSKTNIKDKVKQHGFAKVKKVIRLMNWKNSGKNLIIDKNTTVLALNAEPTLRDETLITIDVPYEYHKHMTLLQAKHMGNQLNDNVDGVNSYEEDNTDRDAASKFLYDLYFDMHWDKDNLDLKDHKEIHGYLDDYKSLTDYNKAWAIEDAWNTIEKEADAVRNKHTKNWSEDENMLELIDIIEKYQKIYPNKLIAVLSTSSMGSWHEDLNKQLYMATQGKFKVIKKRKNPNKDGYNYKFEWTDSKPKFYKDILILADGRANKILWDEFRNGKRVYDKNLKKYVYKGNSNWVNFRDWYECGSKHTLDKIELDFWEDDTTSERNKDASKAD